jgi:hypothetical protein
MKEREEKIKRGEPVGPAEPDPREEQEVGWTGLLKLVATIVIFTLLAGKFFTGSYVWNFDGDVKSLWPVSHILRRQGIKDADGPTGQGHVLYGEDFEEA